MLYEVITGISREPNPSRPTADKAYYVLKRVDGTAVFEGDLGNSGNAESLFEGHEKLLHVHGEIDFLAREEHDLYGKIVANPYDIRSPGLFLDPRNEGSVNLGISGIGRDPLGRAEYFFQGKGNEHGRHARALV